MQPAPTTHTKIIPNPSESDLQDIKDFADTHWDTPPSPDEDLEFFEQPRLIVSASLGDTRVSSLVVFFKSLLIDNSLLHFAGIGGVVTHHDYRHQGFAAATLKHTIDYLRSLKLGAALLCTDIPKLGALYSSVGFAAIGKPYYFYDKLGKLRPEPSGMYLAFNQQAATLLAGSRDPLIVGSSNF